MHYAARASEPAGLLVSDLTLHERGLVVDVVTGKTRHSVGTARIVRQDDPDLCPVVAWETYRTHLAEEADLRWSAPEAPAWVSIDRWGHVTGGMTPDSITRAIRRASTRAGIRIAWTGHSLRIGHATLARQRGVDTTLIADQGGWARHSRALAGYIQHEDGWETTSSAHLT
ncbi:tyrosine-type recombinase/integrase [Streptomyces sp. 3MP-14]|uniref:tyrosine-type recombinase/integrase n=1 Tax=Streptomyces sp. 3MP-14 TaxID=2586636 RepID=UPI00221FA314|nr:tyrosine-type recombinase/integrase [Streptomyces sp. 3MP-14]